MLSLHKVYKVSECKGCYIPLSAFLCFTHETITWTAIKFGV